MHSTRLHSDKHKSLLVTVPLEARIGYSNRRMQSHGRQVHDLNTAFRLRMSMRARSMVDNDGLLSLCGGDIGQ